MSSGDGFMTRKLQYQTFIMSTFGLRYSRMDQTKFVEDSL